MSSRDGVRALISLVLFSFALQAQFEPESAHSNLYFPHLADGGPVGNRWQTSLIFFNPNSTTANITVYFYGDDGKPLLLDFGSSAAATLSLSIPPSGTQTFHSTMASSLCVSGWAMAFATVPVQGTVLFRNLQNGVAHGEVSALGTQPTLIYYSTATKFLGVAIANIYSQQSIQVTVSASDSNGNGLGTVSYSLEPNGHTSFNLDQAFPALTDSFNGSIKITGPSPTAYFAAWTLQVDSDLGSFASLPPGGLSWPISHWDRIWDVFRRIWAITQSGALPANLQHFGANPPQLNILTQAGNPPQYINAFGSATAITVTYGLSELISDSPSELAFTVGHEMGHVYQFRTGRYEFNTTDPEFDADTWGLLLSLMAGYDPYAAAGALAKLGMVTGQAGLMQQFEAQLATDAHKSFNTRLDALYQTIESACTLGPAICNSYKQIIHPGFPPSAPLSVRSPSRPQ